MSNLKLAFPIIALILILTGVYAYNFYSVHTVEGSLCELTGKQCTLKTTFGKVIFQADRYPLELEEEIAVFISLNADYKLEKSWVEGTNMFMGIIPVVIDEENIQNQLSQYSGMLFIGSCTEPNMRWQLLLNVRHRQTDEFHQLAIRFATQR